MNGRIPAHVTFVPMTQEPQTLKRSDLITFPELRKRTLKKISRRMERPLCGSSSRPVRMLTASAWNRQGQYVSSPAHKAYCYIRTTHGFFPSDGHDIGNTHRRMARLSWPRWLAKYEDGIAISVLGTNPVQRRAQFLARWQ